MSLEVKEYTVEFEVLGEKGFRRKYRHPFILHPGFCERNQTALAIHTRERGVSEIIEIEGRSKLLPVTKTDRNPWADKIYLGRAKNNDIVIPVGTISKMHGYFVQDGKTYSFADDSSNGTKLNGRDLERDILTPVQPGDVLHFSGFKTEFVGLERVVQIVKSFSDVQKRHERREY